MQARTTRKGVTDNYTEAKNAILQRAGHPNATEYMWIEVSEGKREDSMDYVLHASNDASSVPPFSIETYKRGQLENYEVRKDTIKEYMLMPEETRQAIVQAQKASDLVDRVSQKAVAYAAP